jgi:hypothetical protein
MDVMNYLFDKFSFSKLSTFSKCPRRAFYRYVMRKKEPPNVALLFGRAVHNGQETDNYEKLKGRVLPVKQVLEAATESYGEEARDAGLPVDVDDFVGAHGRQLEVFEASGERAKIRPIPGTVEAAFEISLLVGDGEGPKTKAIIEGFTDVVSESDSGRVAVDYKTTSRPISTRDAEANIQLGLEAIGAQAAAAQIVSFVKPGKQKATAKVTAPIVTTQKRWEKVLAFLADTIHSFRKCLKSGDFPRCDPSCHWCSPEACEFYSLCFPDKVVGLERWIQITDLKPAGTLPPADWRMSKAGLKEAQSGKTEEGSDAGRSGGEGGQHGPPVVGGA